MPDKPESGKDKGQPVKDAIDQEGAVTPRQEYAKVPETSKDVLPPIQLDLHGDVRKVDNEQVLRTEIGSQIAQAKLGKNVTFSINETLKIYDQGQPSKKNQASILYEELHQAYPDRHFVFSKPDLNPGDKGYEEIPAPKVAQDGLHISTKENRMTLGKGITLADGTAVPAGSQFAVGTTYDGTVVKSADPQGKVWAVTPDGQYIQVAADGQSAKLTRDAISQDIAKVGQVVNRFGKDIDPKTGQPYENHIIVRRDKENAPDGRALLDSYPAGGPRFQAAYKPGSTEGYYAATAKKAEHFLLPANVTVEADKVWGHSTASGAKNDYYLISGIADAQDATAKNYTGPTDPRSAAEIVRIRKEQGFTEVTQAEASLRASEVAPGSEAFKTVGDGPEQIKESARELRPLVSLRTDTSSQGMRLLEEYIKDNDIDVTRHGKVDPHLSASAIEGAVSHYRDLHGLGLATTEQVTALERLAEHARSGKPEASLFKSTNVASSVSGKEAVAPLDSAHTTNSIELFAAMLDTTKPSEQNSEHLDTQRAEQARLVLREAMVDAFKQKGLNEANARDFAERLSSGDSDVRLDAKDQLSTHFKGGEAEFERAISKHIEARGPETADLVSKWSNGRSLLTSLAIVVPLVGAAAMARSSINHQDQRTVGFGQ
jgi:hypothetical protein